MKTLVLYMPALHAGYTQMIKKLQPDRIYLINNEFAASLIPSLGRDVRALKTNEMVEVVKSLFPKIVVRTMDQKNLSALDNLSSAYLPNEDISEVLIKKHLPNIKPHYMNVFLRWDMGAVNRSLKHELKHKISKSQQDQKFMSMARKLAEQSSDWWRQIGAVLVKDDAVVLKAYNQPYPDKNYSIEVLGDPKSNFGPGEKIDLSKFIHAEAHLISEAARNGISTDNTSLYVTTFPCPVCARLVANAGIKKVFYQDGYSIFDAEEIFKNKGIEVSQVE